MTTEFPVYSRRLAVSHGDGVWLWGQDGKRYLDLYAGHAVSALGYGDPEVLEVLESSAKTLFFQSNSVVLESRDQAVDALGTAMGGGSWSTFLVNSGAEANENALRLAFRGTDRKVIVAVEGAFHGRTAAAASVTWGSQGWYGFPSAPFEVRWIDPNRIDEVRGVIADDVAAVIVEPVQGVAGARALSDELLREVDAVAKQHGVLVIADEVQSGAGRTGPFCAFQATPLNPDIVTLGKGIAAGFPAGAVLAREDLVSSLKVGDFGTTFGGGPMASSLISLVTSRVIQPGHRDRVERIGHALRKGCLEAGASEVVGKGLLTGFRSERPAKDVQLDLMHRGIIVGDAKDPHIVRLLPPLILDSDHVDTFKAALREVVL